MAVPHRPAGLCLDGSRAQNALKIASSTTQVRKHASSFRTLVLIGIAAIFCAVLAPLSALGLELVETDRSKEAVLTWDASEVIPRTPYAPPHPRTPAPGGRPVPLSRVSRLERDQSRPLGHGSRRVRRHRDRLPRLYRSEFLQGRQHRRRLHLRWVH